MKTFPFRSGLVLGLLALSLVAFAGCSSGPSPNSIAVSASAAKTSLDQGQMSSVTATVTDDSANKGVTWSVSCSAASCGTISPQSTASGTAAMYTAPSNAASVTITAASVTNTSKTGTVTITVNTTPSAMPPAGNNLPVATVGAAYSFNLDTLLSGGTPPFTWAITGGVLPAGLSLSSSGMITGTPTAPTAAGRQRSGALRYAASGASVTITFTATDSGNPPVVTMVTLNIAVNPAPLMITTASLANGTTQLAYGPGGAGVTVTATGGITPYTWSWTAQSGSSLPPGLAIGASSGTITGTPTTVGTYNVTVAVTDSETPTAMSTSANFTIVISAPAALAIQTTTLGNGTVNTAFNASLSATGGITPYAWSWVAQSGSSLPPGLNIATNADNTGTISGTPAAMGTYNVTVTVTDSETPTAMSVSANFTIVINAALACTPSGTTLCGQFAIFVQGYDSHGAYVFAGTFTSNGTAITAGVLDFNSFGGTAVNVAVIAGSPSAVSVGSDGRGTLTLATSNSTIGNPTFAFALNSAGTDAGVIEFDDTTTAGTGRHGSGSLKAQDSTAFSASAITGNFAFVAVGGNSVQARLGMVGLISAGSTGCGLNSNGSTTTVNEAGTITSGDSFTCTGSTGLPSIGSTTGRGTVTFSYAAAVGGASTLDYSFYVVTSTKLIFVVTDTPSATSPVLGGTIKAQKTPSGGFSTSNLACGLTGSADTGCVFVSSGVAASADSHVGAGRVVQTAAGTYSETIDDNKAGVVNSGSVALTVNSVASGGNAKVTPASGSVTDIVLTDTDSGMYVAENNGVDVGMFGPQTSETLSSSPGRFYGASLYVANTAVPSISGVITPSAPGTGGAGTLSGTLDAEQIFASPFLIPGASITGSYTLSTTTGRATGSSTSPGPSQFVIWILSSTSFVVVETDSTNVEPVVLVFTQ